MIDNIENRITLPVGNKTNKIEGFVKGVIGFSASCVGLENEHYQPRTQREADGYFYERA